MKGLLSTIFLLSLFCCQGLAAENLALLRYDDGVPEDGMWIDSNRGHAVKFTSPASNWTLSKIAISGRLNPESDQNLIVLEIRDENFDLLYSRADNPKSYFGDEMAWAEIDVPDITISGDFIVCLFEFSSVYVGSDLSNTSSGRSFVVSRDPNRIDTWDLPYPRNETDWSIAAVGLSPAPIVNLDLKSSGEAVIVEAKITDPDKNLAGASMQVVDNESLDVLWSEQRLIEGGEANLTFTWPFEIFQITNDTITLEPIFEVNTIGVSPDREFYMAYLVPCLIRLTSDDPLIEGAAYFGQDGEFHALIDGSGFTHYMSTELLGVVQPQKSYGDYIKTNMILAEGISSLSFYNLNLEKGLVVYPPMVLARSPLHHYKVKLNHRMTADLGGCAIRVYVVDSARNQVSLLASSMPPIKPEDIVA